tara:strand:+ start:50 stop:304 length:255 start_codon:yes stop_codon:yes gene_type:complete
MNNNYERLRFTCPDTGKGKTHLILVKSESKTFLCYVRVKEDSEEILTKFPEGIGQMIHVLQVGLIRKRTEMVINPKYFLLEPKS